MGKAQNRLQQRKEAKNVLDQLFKQANMVNVIHYSCESFYDRKNGKSPRITSIAICNLADGQTISFSIHQMAERHHYDLDQIDQHYDELEQLMLEEFYEYVRQHMNYKWLHWRMRDINYGFAALEHRFKVLGGNPTHIPETSLYDLANILTDIYGRGYVDHPQLENIVNKNNITKYDFLPGKAEAAAFESKEYVKLHQSTLRKVNVIASIAERAWNEELKTNATWRQQYGTTIAGFAEAITDHPAYKILGAVGIIASLVSLIPLFW